MTWADELLVVFPVVFVVLIAVQVAAMISLYRSSASRRPRNVSDERREPPAKVAPLIADLVTLGFERLGELELTLPGVTGVDPLLRRQRSHTIWVLIDRQDTTVADVGPVGPTVNLNSTLADGSVVETTYPRGPQIDDTDLWSGHVSTSLADAYHAQRVALDRRVDTHGQPQEIHNIADCLRLDASYRERFAKRVLRRPLITTILIPTAVAIAAAIVATAWVISTARPAQ